MNKEKHGISIPLITAAMALLGAFGGAFLTHLFTSAREQQSSLVEVRSAAYSEFFRGQALLWSAADEGGRVSATKAIDNAKLQIVMASSIDVISAMVEYWQQYDSLLPCEPPEKWKDDAKIYQAIRNETFKVLDLQDPEVAPDILVPFLFGCLLPEASGGGNDR